MQDGVYTVYLNIKPFLFRIENFLTVLNVVIEKKEISFSELYVLQAEMGYSF